MNRAGRLFGGLLTAGLVGGFLSGVAACGGAATASQGPRPVIIDTDMGSDDIMALAYLLERHDIAIRAITVEGTGLAHGPAGARNALRLIRALGIRQAIPVAYGPPDPVSGFRSFPLEWRATADNMYNLALPGWSGPKPANSAVRLLVETIKKSPQRVDVITLGPFTNLARALRADPQIAHRIAMVYSMAGAMRVAGNEPFHLRAEWNVYIDATAAQQVLRSGVPMTFIPLDASDNVPITLFVRDAVQAQPRTPAVRLITTMLRDPYYIQAPTYFWDPLAAVAATNHRVVRLQAERLRISTGQGPDVGVIRVNSAGTLAHVAVAANAASFQRQFLATLTDGRPVPVPAVPLSHRMSVTFDGRTYRYQGPRGVFGGPLQVRLANRSPVPFDGFQLVVGKLARGRSLSSVQAVIRQGTATNVPAWFKVTAILPAAATTQPAWGLSLQPGNYALVCVRDSDGALYPLTEVTIR